MMNHDVPRGTAAPFWPELLAQQEAEQSGDADTDYAQLRRRQIAAGYAHIARLAIDGGPVTEPRPIRRRYTLQTVGLIGIGICALGIVVGLYGVIG